MSEPIEPCAACGSSRVTFGHLDGGQGGIAFRFPEYKPGYWYSLSNVPYTVDIEADRVRLCLACGVVTASMKVDLKEAKRVLDRWGTDPLKALMGNGPAAPLG